jgi:hypothetical protein
MEIIAHLFSSFQVYMKNLCRDLSLRKKEKNHHKNQKKYKN